MSTSTLSTFITLLRKSQLLTAEQVAELGGDLPVRFPEAKALARELVRRGWVTAYQVHQLTHSKGAELVLGQYTILERLGEGGMGEVFKARHRNMGRVVALKVLRKERLSNPDAVKRFHREIQAAARLSHPNIVMAYDADAVGGSHFFVMEYVDGTDLSRLVKKQGPLSPVRACNYIYQAALALQHAHEQEMVHRDIKPHNLLLSKDGQTVKVLDMGLARLAENDQDSGFSALTQDGKVVGTPDYIAPEQARNSHTADVRSDIYSLGCTFYFIISGKVPFPGGSSIMEKLMKHQTEDPIPIQLVAPNVPDRIAEIIHKMIRRKPEDRYQTPADAARALEPFALATESDIVNLASPMNITGTTGTLGSMPLLKLPPAEASRRRGSRRWLVAGVIAAILVLVGVTVAGVMIASFLGRRSSTIATKPEPSGPGPAEKELTVLDRLEADQVPAHRRPPGRLEGLVAVLGEPRGRHWGAGPINRIVFSRDGRFVATACPFTDSALRLWDANSLRPRGRLPAGTVINFTIAPDSQSLTTMASDGTLKVWDVSEQGRGKMLVQHRLPPMMSVVFTEDGRGGAGIVTQQDFRAPKIVKVWESRSGNVLRSLTIPEGFVTSLAFSPSGHRLAITVINQGDAKGASLRIWDLRTEKVHTLGEARVAGTVLFTPDEKWLVAVAFDGARVVNLETGAVRALEEVANALAPVLSPDGKTLALVGANPDGKRTARLWNLETGKPRGPAVNLEQFSFLLAFTPDSRELMSLGMRDTHVRFWDVASGKETAPLKGAGSAMAYGFAANGKRVALGTPSGALRLWNLPSRDEVVHVGEPAGPALFTALVDDRILWTGSREPEATGMGIVGALRRWDLGSGGSGEAPLMRDQTRAEACWAYDPVHKVLASTSMTSQGGMQRIAVKLWDAESGQAKQMLEPIQTPWVSALAFTPDGKTLAAAAWMPKTTGGQTTILFRDPATGAERGSIIERQDQLQSLRFSPDGKTLAALGRDNTLRLWDAASHKERSLSPAPGVTQTIYSFAFSPDSKLLASGGNPGSDHSPVRLWDPASGKVRHTFPGNSAVATLAFRPDGKALASATQDGHLTLWDVDNATPLREWRLQGVASSLCFSRDGRYLISGNANGTVYIFRLE